MEPEPRPSSTEDPVGLGSRVAASAGVAAALWRARVDAVARLVVEEIERHAAVGVIRFDVVLVDCCRCYSKAVAERVAATVPVTFVATRDVDFRRWPAAQGLVDVPDLAGELTRRGVASVKVAKQELVPLYRDHPYYHAHPTFVANVPCVVLTVGGDPASSSSPISTRRVAEKRRAEATCPYHRAVDFRARDQGATAAPQGSPSEA